PPAPTSTLFPYTTLFRSGDASKIHETQLAVPHEGRRRVLRDPGNALRPEVADVRHPRPCSSLVLAGRGHPQLGLGARGDSAHPQDRKSTRLNSSHLGISY